MQIPVGAPEPFTAEKFMDYVYHPEIQAQIEAYINYICPVDGVKEVIAKTHKSPRLRTSDLPSSTPPTPPTPDASDPRRTR